LLKQKIIDQSATELPDSAAVISVVDDNPMFLDLAASLVEIRKLNGIMGYILRSNTSAIIDLADQDKINEYAILSSQICESSNEMAKQFNLTNIKSVLVEGKTVKLLCLNMSDNRISVFMEKTATFDSLIKRIQQQSNTLI
jgi:predicted regulator of Ras-like GTPase activity (Roadblock/LC7/MglB family)